MSVRFVLDGFDEMIAQLTREPDEVRAEARPLVVQHTEGFADELRSSYPTRKRVLRNRVRTDYPSQTVLAGKVQNTAPHAHLWHWGTKTRTTRLGKNRGAWAGANPEPLVAIATRRRGQLMDDIKAMLERRGYVVTGV